MKHLDINQPCTENWNEMTPTEKGAFCQKCAMQVFDFSNQTPEEIRSTLFHMQGQRVCGRIDKRQLEELNSDFEAWRQANSWSMQRVSFYAILFVFGLSIVSCARQEDEQKIIEIQNKAQNVIQEVEPQKEIIEKQVISELPPPPIVEEIEPLEEIEIVDRIIEFDSIEMIHESRREMRYETMGDMISTRYFVEYLEEVVPIEEEVRDEEGRLIPLEFNALAFPNPTNGRTTLKFEVPEKTRASFELYSMSGGRIRSLGSDKYQPGTYEIPFDLSREEPGTYMITIISKNYKESVKIIKL